jgi:hypothetical protein
MSLRESGECLYPTLGSNTDEASLPVISASVPIHVGALLSRGERNCVCVIPQLAKFCRQRLWVAKQCLWMLKAEHALSAQVFLGGGEGRGIQRKTPNGSV